MMFPPARFATIVVLVAAFVGAGCSSGTPGPTSAGSNSSTTSNASAASGTTTHDTDAKAGRSGTFEVVPPEGWVDGTAQVGDATSVDLMLVSSTKVDGFANNLVVQSSTDGNAAAEIDKGRSSMSVQGRTVTDAPALTIGGVAASGFVTTSTEQGHAVAQVFYGLDHAGRTYLLTLSSATQDSANARTQFTEIVGTWSWLTK